LLSEREKKTIIDLYSVVLTSPDDLSLGFTTFSVEGKILIIRFSPASRLSIRLFFNLTVREKKRMPLASR